MATGKGIEDLASTRPRDLLRLFVREELRRDSEVVEAEEMELSLGLSLGGSFGVEPREKWLHRSSSISTLSMFPTESDLSAVSAPLSRTCSMPVDTEEEHRKRKELQSLKRMEAKRKRLEKRRIRSGATTEVKDEILDEETNGEPGNSVDSNGFPGFPTNLGTANKGELPLWAKRGGASTSPISQGSIGSQGSSSTVSNSPKQGLEPPSDHKAATMAPAPTGVKPAVISGEGGGPETKTAGRANVTREMERSMMEDMPCVSTKGDGPNGRRIEGFLYKYRKGEEVRIVCVCHGSFLTPAEFVKHAGGVDVTHPLRHIVVSPFPATFL